MNFKFQPVSQIIIFFLYYLLLLLTCHKSTGFFPALFWNAKCNSVFNVALFEGGPRCQTKMCRMTTRPAFKNILRHQFCLSHIHHHHLSRTTILSLSTRSFLSLPVPSPPFTSLPLTPFSFPLAASPLSL